MIYHYQILNVSENATIVEIKIAYRKLAILYHPDKNKNLDANQKFIKIKESYDVLLDPIKRKKFDKELEIHRLQSKIYSELNKRKIKPHHPKIHKKNRFRKFILVFIISISIVIINRIIKYTKTENINNIPAIIRRIDSSNIEDKKIENQLKNIEEKEYSNGDLKF